ncbi:MAG: biopolymer transporter ExbD [Gammaproteobacteria bacterium]|nr:biopolymer transporter ExbD [Gammaproteobacteria bacterium]
MSINTRRFSGQLLEPTARPRSNADDGMIPLINIVFLLLVFFMVAGQLAAPPSAAFDAPDSGVQQPLAEGDHTLLLGADHSLWLDGQLLPELTLEALRGAGVAADQTLVLQADANLPAASLDPLLPILRSAGLAGLQLVVESSGAGR